MKPIVLLLLPLLCIATPFAKPDDPLDTAANQAAQLGSWGASVVAAPFKPFKIEETKKTILKDGIKRINIWYGPFTVKGQNSSTKAGNVPSMDPAGTAWQYAAEDIPRDITVLKSNVTLVYTDGTKADVSNGVYQHHSYITAATKKLPSWFNCGTSKMLFESLSPGSLFIGGSEDKYGGYYTTPTGDLNSGYYISKEDKLIMNGDVINYTPADKIVYTLNEIEYMPGKAKGLMEASMYVMVPAQCEGQFGIISGAGRSPQFSVKGKAMTVTRDATILAFRGHLHDGGDTLSVTINNQTVCESKAKYGPAAALSGIGAMGSHERNVADPGPHGDALFETIVEMSQCYGPIEVKKGDTYLLEAKYDTVKHPVRHQPKGGEAEMMALGVAFMALRE
ncbi:hypothetical protein EG328_011894 [Venturia inaequalis]|uniref:Uncharacterized protein n=1 Tax=Venturia inaequalis TaxID=5025 RepID=A0A8H3Z2P1_VENIN|nr:hypothetical protein EG328_011894 [Venturia inaequalis]